MHPTRRRAALALSVLALFVPACGDDPAEPRASEPPRDAPVASSPPATGELPVEPVPGQPAPLRSRRDLRDLHPFEPESVTADPTNARRLLVRLWGGVEPCFGVEVRVVETATQVEVTVLGGTPPEGRDRACIALAKYYEVGIDLAAPLGARTIVIRS